MCDYTRGKTYSTVQHAEKGLVTEELETRIFGLTQAKSLSSVTNAIGASAKKATSIVTREFTRAKYPAFGAVIQKKCPNH
mmetsp:Transcript_20570/g.28752  ORF Transcript_20570/g.28752 Transcript_20570/m.28752 type:complete len:80 (-) Transcript_20570:140-379(-)